MNLCVKNSKEQRIVRRQLLSSRPRIKRWFSCSSDLLSSLFRKREVNSTVSELQFKSTYEARIRNSSSVHRQQPSRFEISSVLTKKKIESEECLLNRDTYLSFSLLRYLISSCALTLYLTILFLNCWGFKNRRIQYLWVLVLRRFSLSSSSSSSSRDSYTSSFRLSFDTLYSSPFDTCPSHHHRVCSVGSVTLSLKSLSILDHRWREFCWSRDVCISNDRWLSFFGEKESIPYWQKCKRSSVSQNIKNSDHFLHLTLQKDCYYNRKVSLSCCNWKKPGEKTLKTPLFSFFWLFSLTVCLQTWLLSQEETGVSGSTAVRFLFFFP